MLPNAGLSDHRFGSEDVIGLMARTIRRFVQNSARFVGRCRAVLVRCSVAAGLAGSKKAIS